LGGFPIAPQAPFGKSAFALRGLSDCPDFRHGPEKVLIVKRKEEEIL